MKTFKQGIHPKYNKSRTEDRNIVEAVLPKKVIIPLHQHTGATCEPLVKVGDEVVEGQKIGDTSKFISAPVHTPISGKVTKIEKLPHPCGVNILSVVIEGDGEKRDVISDTPRLRSGQARDVDVSPEEIRKIVREAGIVGLGGAAFPTHVKLTPPKDKEIDTILINGCECEPFITADHRIMLERAEDLIQGAKLIAKATGAKNIVIGIENNKLNAIERLKTELRNKPVGNITITVLETKYPQGGEKMMIKAVLGREVPTRGLPLDVGVVVCNVGTAVAVTEAVRNSIPLIKRVVTVTGSGIKEPQNLMVRIGTTFQEIIDQCGGLNEVAAKVIMGGPMMGVSQHTLDIPIVKATSCILVLSRHEVADKKLYPCIKCSKCVDHCPMFLVPTRLAAYAENGKYSEFEEWGGLDCIECGCCTFVCPAAIPLVHWIKLAKLKLRQMK
ncbi:MAG: electron transport complex subunit RsxC [Candidatus Margulisiibacteriota bacterium]|nr:electron transport complex subunit RsxC [Candidatus Margulisiibacteriota bacterium]